MIFITHQTSVRLYCITTKHIKAEIYSFETLFVNTTYMAKMCNSNEIYNIRSAYRCAMFADGENTKMHSNMEMKCCSSHIYTHTYFDCISCPFSKDNHHFH